MGTARAIWDAEQIARAVEYTTSRFQGVGQYDTRRFETLGAAEADAAGDRRAMMYAITPEGWSIHIANGNEIKPKETTMKTYSSKTNATRAARAEYGPEAIPGTDFHLIDQYGKFGYAPGPVGAEPVTVETAVDAPSAPVKETREEKRLRKIAEADAKNKAKAAAPKPEKAPRQPKAPKAPGARAAALEAAQRGEMPTAPDFTADTHARFRKKLAEIVALAEAGDVKGLKAYDVQPISSSRQAMDRYRNLAVIALEARAVKAAA